MKLIKKSEYCNSEVRFRPKVEVQKTLTFVLVNTVWADFTFASVDSIVNLWTGDFVHISDLNVERLHRVSNTILRHLYCLTSTYLAWSTNSLSRIENPTSLTTFSSPDSKSNRPGSNPTEQLQLTLLSRLKDALKVHHYSNLCKQERREALTKN